MGHFARGSFTRSFAATAVLVGVLGGVAGTASARTASQQLSSAARRHQAGGGAALLRATGGEVQPSYTWPKIAHDPGNTGLTADPTISTANAGSLGVSWMAATGATSVSSPVAAWNATLQKTLVYVGNNAGYFTAFDQLTGATLWSASLGTSIVSSPVVEGGNVWVSREFSPTLYKLNAATGATECSVALTSASEGSPTVGTPAGGSTAVYIGVNDTAASSGPIYSIAESNCAVNWKSTAFNSVAGSWDPLSFATAANGRSVILAGTADPDNTVYAFDALTGAKTWSFKTYPQPGTGNTDIDVGAGVAVSPPGVNGFADGVAYVPGEDGYMFALDLTTGAKIWTKYFGYGIPSYHAARATPAINGTELVFGESNGVMAMSALTGQILWKYSTGDIESLSAASVMGPQGSQVVAVTTVAGTLAVLDAATGAVDYSLQTPSYSTSSVADVDGNLLISSADGFLYDVTLGGGNGPAPTTAVTFPASGSNVANPKGNLTLAGTATGAAIAGVKVAIQSGGPSGPWWDGASGTWTPGFWDNEATLASPGAANSQWSYQLPVGAGAVSLRVLASSYQSNGLADVTDLTPNPGATNVAFNVLNAPGTPHVYASSGVWVAPGATVSLAGSGFAAGETVVLSLAGTTLGTVTASATGALPATTVTVPATAGFGPAAVVATGSASGRSGNAAIDISNSWAGAGYNSLHTNFEPNDPVLLNSAAQGPPKFLSQAWVDSSAGSVRTTPAVANDIIYYGDDTGTVSAVEVRNGQPLWSTVVGSPVDSSPVLGGSRLFFGTEGRSGSGVAPAVVALNQADGSTAWSTPTTSPVESAPALASGRIIVGSDDGTVYDILQGSGAVAWTATLGGAVTASPSVDPATGLVIVGDASGAVTALSSATGAVVWRHSTGGPVTAAASVYSGKVYVGSADGSVYALSETTGAPIWVTPTGAAVTTTGAIYSAGAGPNVYTAGSADGTLRLFDLSSGQVLMVTALSSAPVGLATSAGWMVVTTANGQVWGLKRHAEPIWTTPTGPTYATAPIVVDGVVYTTGTDATVRAYTIPGRPIP